MDKKKLAIMQPYFFPYIGYFQLIAAVDIFVIYDNIKYTKKGWINRNRILQNGKDSIFSLPLKAGSDFLDIRDREVSKDFNPEKLLKQIKGAYQKAPYFESSIQTIQEILFYKNENLFQYLYNSISEICKYLDIKSKIYISSEIAIDHQLKGQDKVLDICRSLNACIYINAIGGRELYLKENFKSKGFELKFIKTEPILYEQFSNNFIPWLSIIDVIMFNSPSLIKEQFLNSYNLI